jgi:hypothetical protein
MFVLLVQTAALNHAIPAGRGLAVDCVYRAMHCKIPDETEPYDLRTYAQELVDYFYGMDERPEWLV